jgi:hypothetical protein
LNVVAVDGGAADTLRPRRRAARPQYRLAVRQIANS